MITVITILEDLHDEALVVLEVVDLHDLVVADQDEDLDEEVEGLMLAQIETSHQVCMMGYVKQKHKQRRRK